MFPRTNCVDSGVTLMSGLINAAFYDTDIDNNTDTEILVRNLARMSVSMLVSCNVAFTMLN